jgi:hypothetical protein
MIISVNPLKSVASGNTAPKRGAAGVSAGRAQLGAGGIHRLNQLAAAPVEVGPNCAQFAFHQQEKPTILGASECIGRRDQAAKVPQNQ